jgi:hypothetical protein
MRVRMYSAQVVPDDAVGDRVVRTSLQRGPHAVVVVCGGCATWLAVGHRPENVPDVLLRCSACGAVSDPRAATPVSGAAAVEAAPAGLAPSEVWARSVVERVHALAEQERRWPWRAG